MSSQQPHDRLHQIQRLVALRLEHLVVPLEHPEPVMRESCAVTASALERPLTLPEPLISLVEPHLPPHSSLGELCQHACARFQPLCHSRHTS
jgi:hypothetical protein